MARKRGPGVYGPYERDGKWRLFIESADGKRASKSFGSKAEALACKSAYLQTEAARRRASSTGKPMSQALAEYEQEVTGSIKASTLKERMSKLRAWFGECQYVNEVSNGLVVSKYASRVQECATATHHLELGMARSFLEWCRGRGYLAVNPAAGVRRVGSPNRGKPRLRGSEAARLTQWCLGQPPGAYDVVLCALLLGMRASEIGSRVVRDVDVVGDSVTLWITSGKTINAERRLAVPEPLASRLVTITRGRPPEALVWPQMSRQTVREYVHKACIKAGVPVVCAHGLRATFATLARDIGQATMAVAAALGQGGTKVTLDHYIQAGADQSAKSRAVMRVIEGGAK